MTDDALVAPRPLAEGDASRLRALVASQLILAGDGEEEAAEDAADLVDYAVDMVRRGKSVGSVVEELEFMQYDVCDAAVAKNIGRCLTSFLREMQKEVGLPAASRKASREIRQTLSSGSASAAQRSKRHIYDESGRLVKQWAGVQGAEEEEGHAQIGPYRQQPSQDSARPYADSDVLHATADARAEAKGQIYDEEGNLHAWNSKGSASTKAAELSALKSHQQRQGVKGKIYDESGQLNAWSKFKTGGDDGSGGLSAESSADPNEMKRREFELVMKDRSLSREERTRRVADIKKKYSAGSSGSQGEEKLDLSALAFSRKTNAEMKAALITSEISAAQRNKRDIYDENGNLVKQWNNLRDEDENEDKVRLSADAAAKKHHNELSSLRSKMDAGFVKGGMYNECGEIVGGDSSVKERPRHNPGMDLSTKGTLRKKAEELDAIRESGTQRRCVKGQIYDASGNLNAWKSLQDRECVAELEERDVDLTATGQQMKKAREIESLLASGNEKNIVEHMYDADGNIVAYANNDEELIRHNPDMDTSAVGMISKKAQEMEFLRTSSQRLMGDSKTQMYDEHGNLLAWTGMKKLASGEGDGEHCPGDLGGEMRVNLTREMQAIRTGAVDYRATVAPRKLDEEEASTLRSLLTPKLRIPNDNYKDDASDLLDYALDMVAEGYNVGFVVKELVFMEMVVLDAELAEGFAHCLAAFLLSLGGDTSLASRDKKGVYDEEGNLIKQWASVTEQKKERRIDLSAMAAAQRQGREMEETLLAEAVSAKERSKQGIYDANGVLVSQWASLDERSDDGNEEAVHGINLSAAAASKRAGHEVDSVLVKKKSGGGLGHRLAKYAEFVKPRVNLHHEGDDHDEARMKALDLSAKAFARKSGAEMRATLLTSETSAAQRGKEGIYDESGVLVKQWAKVKGEDGEHGEHMRLPDAMSKSESLDIQRQRREELQAVMRDRSLGKEERAARIEAVKAKYAGDVPLAGDDQRKEGLVLSALDFSRKASREVQAMDKGAKERSRKDIYDENGVLVKQWEQVDLKEIGDVDAHIDEQRRLHFQKMSDEENLRERIARRDQLRAEQRAEQEESKRAGQGLTSGNSAKMQALKQAQEVQATLSGVSAAKRGKQDIYDENGVLVKQWANVKGEDESSAVSQPSPVDDQRREELQAIMRDSSLSRDERAQRIEEVKARYAGVSMSKQDNESSAYTGNLKVVENKELDEQRKKEFSAIMRDRSLSREERSRRIEEIKKKYSTGSTASVATQEEEDEEKLDASLLAFARKNSAGMQARKQAQELKETLLSSSETSAAQRGKQGIYDESGVLVKQWASVKEDDGGGEQTHLPDSYSMSESLDVQRKRREELQAVMRDRSLSKEERAARIEEVKAKYGGNQLSGSTALPGDDSQKEGLRLTSVNSAKMQARKAAQEVQAMDKGAKERSKKDNYDDDGVLVKQWEKKRSTEITDIDAHIDEQRRLYFQKLNEEQNLRERIARRDQLRAEQRAEQEEAKLAGKGLTSGNSAKMQAMKQAEEVQATLSGVRAAQRSKRGIYDEDGVLVKQWANVKEDEEAEEENLKSADFKTFMAKSLDEQRKEELQRIMRDRSLNKDERAERIEEVKAKFAAIADGKPGPLKKTTCNTHGKSAALDDQRRRELRAIMKDHSLDRDEKNRLLEEIKLKYDAMEPSQDKEAPPPVQRDTVKAEEEESGPAIEACGDNVQESGFIEAKDKDSVQTESKSKSESLDIQRKRKEELQAIMRNRSLSKEERTARIEAVKAKYAGNAHPAEDAADVVKDDGVRCGVHEPVDLPVVSIRAKPSSSPSKERSVKDRMAAFNNNSFVPNYDPVAFAVSKNKAHSFKTEQAAKRDAAESNMKYNYNYGDGGVVDKTSADFKTMGDDIKAAKNEAKESANRYDYRY